MSAAYAAFARGGYYIEPYTFTKVVYLETEQEYTHPVEKVKVMSDTTAYMITDMLVSAGKANVGGNFTISGTDIGAKTGTTTIDNESAKRLNIPSYATPDHWDMVFSPDYCIGLWHGYDQLEYNGPYLNSTNGTIAKKAIITSIAKKVFKTNSKFEKPTGVVSATIETETYPTQLASEYTPDTFKLTELYQRGYEPAEVSNRFSTLLDPTNGKYVSTGTTITVSWDPIAIPDAINPEKIEEMYNNSDYWNFYEKYKSQFYEARIEYNNSSIGSLGYQVYLKDSSGNLNFLGFTSNTSFTYHSISNVTDYEFVIKSAYSIFKDNMSSGITIHAKVLDNVVPGTPSEEETVPDIENENSNTNNE